MSSCSSPSMEDISTDDAFEFDQNPELCLISDASNVDKAEANDNDSDLSAHSSLILEPVEGNFCDVFLIDEDGTEKLISEGERYNSDQAAWI